MVFPAVTGFHDVTFSDEIDRFPEEPGKSPDATLKFLDDSVLDIGRLNRGIQVQEAIALGIEMSNFVRSHE